MNEMWLPVVRYMGLYEVSDAGRVKSVDRIVQHSNGRTQTWPGRVLKTARLPAGHLLVTLCHDGTQKTWQVHRLVMDAFVGPCPEGQECRHLDGDPTNNDLSNLAWGTRAENMRDAVRHGTHPQASKTHCPHGHEYTDTNTRWVKVTSGFGRMCRKCQQERYRR